MQTLKPHQGETCLLAWGAARQTRGEPWELYLCFPKSEGQTRGTCPPERAALSPYRGGSLAAPSRPLFSLSWILREQRFQGSSGAQEGKKGSSPNASATDVLSPHTDSHGHPQEPPSEGLNSQATWPLGTVLNRQEAFIPMSCQPRHQNIRAPILRPALPNLPGTQLLPPFFGQKLKQLLRAVLGVPAGCCVGGWVDGHHHKVMKEVPQGGMAESRHKHEEEAPSLPEPTGSLPHRAANPALRSLPVVLVHLHKPTPPDQPPPQCSAKTPQLLGTDSQAQKGGQALGSYGLRIEKTQFDKTPALPPAQGCSWALAPSG